MISTALLRAVGDTRTPLIITIFANTLNIVGDYILIYGKIGFPEMGVKGAAISTFICSCLEAIIILFFIFSRDTALKLSLKRIKIGWATLKTLFQIGLPAAIEPALTHLGGLFFLKIVAGIGQTALATHHVITRIESISFMPGMGLSIATASLVGQHLGAKRSDLAEQTSHHAIGFAMMIMGTLGLLFLLFPSFIISIFTGDVDVRVLGKVCLIIAAIEQPFLAYGMVHQGVFRGAGNTVVPLYINFIGVWLIRLPLAYLFVESLHWGISGVWMTMPIDWFVRAVIYKIIYQKKHWQKISF
jgi:putative MATE family efflux protein